MSSRECESREYFRAKTGPKLIEESERLPNAENPRPFKNQSVLPSTMGSHSSLQIDIGIASITTITTTTTASKRNRNRNMNANANANMNMNRTMHISPTTKTGRATAAFLVLSCLCLLVPSSSAFMVHPISKNSNGNSMINHRSPAFLSFAVTETRTGTFKSMSMSIARKSHENREVYDDDNIQTTTTTMNKDVDVDTDANTPLMSFPTDDEQLLRMQQQQQQQSQAAQSTEESTESSLSSLSTGRFAQLQRWSEPVQKMLDDGTGGWALSAANLAPDSHKTINGRVFLATNIGYAVAGLVLTWKGDLWFGLMTDLAAIASFNYHYQQLLGSVPKNSANSKPIAAPTNGPPASVKTPEMRLALLIDYIVASVSILTGAFYLWETGQIDSVPIEAVEVAVLSLGCLAACWVWEAGQPYMIFHSLWHLFSAYAGYLIGNTHQVAQHAVHHSHNFLQYFP